MLKYVLQVAWWLGLGLYFGGLVTLGAIVAPTVFETTAGNAMSMPGIAAPPLHMDKEVGGEIFGAALNRFAWVELASLGLMLAGLAGMILLERPARRSAWLLAGFWVVLTALASYDDMSLRPSVWSARTANRAAAVTNASETRPEQVEFDRLHKESELLGRAKVYLMLGMIVVAARPRRVREAVV